MPARPASRPVPSFTPAAELAAAKNGHRGAHETGEPARAGGEPRRRPDQQPAPQLQAAPQVSAWQGRAQDGTATDGGSDDLPPDANAPIPRPIARASGKVIP
jgi:hypothetical protein